MSSLKSYSHIIILLLLITGYVFSFQQVKLYREQFKRKESVHYLPQIEILNILSLDYKGLVSKLLFFKTLVYYGEHMDTRIMPDWKWMYQILNASTILDPYNIDSYYFTQAVLTWDANLIKETNLILERGERYRTWDFYMPFFMGFNYFYFLRDNKNAARYFDRAARINPVLIDYAIRFHYRANEIPLAISILKKMYDDIKNEDIRKQIMQRINAYENALILENAVRQYEEKFHELPDNLEMLIEKRILFQIPQDPYGGKFYFDKKENIVTTTSNFKMMQKNENH
jgi:hypothetical protein